MGKIVAPQFTVQNKQTKEFHVKIIMTNGDIKDIYSESPVSCLVLPNGWFNIKYMKDGLQYRVKLNQFHVKEIEDDGYDPEIFSNK